MTKLDKIKKKIEDGIPVIGSHAMMTDCITTEMMGLVGFDLIWIDTEHTPHDRKDTLLHIIAAAGTNAAAFVRIPWNDPILVKPILEMGVDGIIFPMIKTAEEAKLAVASCRYPPDGIRGFGPIRAVKYGLTDTQEYIESSKSQIWKIMQIEHVDAVNNLDEILEVDGVDAIVVGSNDLSGSIGLLGQTDREEVKSLMDKIGESAAKYGKPFGVSMGCNPPVIADWLRRGINWIVLDSDVSYIMKGCKETLSTAQQLFDNAWKNKGEDAANIKPNIRASTGYI